MIRFLILASVLAWPQVAGAETDGAWHSEILGNWSQPCDAWGVPASCTISWREGLHDSHLIQHYAIHRESDGSQIFSGRGVYRVDGNAVQGAWEGSNGAVHPMSGKVEADALRVIWGTADTEIGRSEYILENDTLMVIDAVLTPEGWRDFMSVIYTRAD